VAFDPDFMSNRFVYVYYTTVSSPIHNRVSRFTASASNPDLAEAGSELQDPQLPTLGATNTTVAPFISGTMASCTWPWARMRCLQCPVAEHARLANCCASTADGSFPRTIRSTRRPPGISRAIWGLGLRNPYTFAWIP
jgi:glucose/arabinose dehydrogenase